MEQIIITKTDGSRVPMSVRRTATIVTSAKQSWTLNGDEVVDITVTSPFPQTYDIGDKITVFGRDYTLNKLPKPKKNGMHDFEYTLQFEGVQYDLLRASYDVTIDTTNNELQDIQGDSLTGNMERFLTVLIANANRVFPGKWKLGTCPDTDSDLTLTFSEDDNCLSVLQNLMTQYDGDYIFEIVKDDDGVYTINVGKLGSTLPFTLEFGKGNGLYQLSRENVDSSNIITRLKVYGSTSNITSKYRADRLCLPNKSKGQSYIEKADAIKQYGVWEARKNFDDIKPTFTGKVMQLGDNVCEFIDTSITFDLNALEDDGVTTKYLIDGTAAKVHFNTGNLAGYEFEISKYDHATHKITLKKQTDDRGDVFPSETSEAFQFHADSENPDTYKLVDIALPQELIDAAESELAEYGNQYYDQNCQPKVQYSLTVTKMWLEKNFATDAGTVNVFEPGDYIQIKDADIDVDKAVRIKTIARNVLDPYDYTITLSDTITKTTTTRVISDLVEIDKVLEINNLKDPTRARANWRTSREVMDMVFDTEGNYYSDKITPNSIDTMALSVGAKSMQFGLQNTVFQPNYNGDPQVMIWQGGVLTHYTINEDSAVSWVLADGGITFNDTNVAYYIYARCNKNNNSGQIVITREQHTVESEANFYWFWIGVVNSVDSELKARSISLTYGFTMINGRFIKTGCIQSADGETYFDLDNGEIGGRIVFTSNGEQKTLEELGAESLESKNYIDNTLPGLLSDLQAQIDGQIEQWFDTYDPLPTSDNMDESNEPASLWIAADEETGGTTTRDTHLGDLFYNTDSGKVWRYVKEAYGANKVGVGRATRYVWTQLSDEELAQALTLAQDALDLAKNKNRIFTSTPYPPYDVGDLWVQGSTGDILQCRNARASGSYVASDWVKASKYTDDTSLTNFIKNSYQTTIESITTQLDGKIESWFQTTDPATSWSDKDTDTNAKIKHVGDTWFDSQSNALRFYRAMTIDGITDIMKSTWSFYKGTTKPTFTLVKAPQHVGDYFLQTSERTVYQYTRTEKTINNKPVYVYKWVAVADVNINYLMEALFTKFTNGVTVYNNVEPTTPYTEDAIYIKDKDVYICTTERDEEDEDGNEQSFNEDDWTLLCSTVYCWQQTFDQTALDAYVAASTAQDTADGKRQVFVDTPYPPYDIGDLWVDGQELRRCITAKSAGQTYDVNDWVIAVYYDNTQTIIDGGIVTSGTIQVAGDTQSILAGITGNGTSSSSIRFWAGASFENRATAPFRVTQSGATYMTNANVTGEIYATKGTMKNATLTNVIVNGSLCCPFKDGYYQLSSSGAVTISTNGLHNNNHVIIPNANSSGFILNFVMPWTSDFSGFKAVILNDDYNGEYTDGIIGCTANSGKYFFEDGKKKSELQLYPHEGVELIGWGENSNFYGWIVLRRFYTDPANSTGFPFKVAYYGSVRSNGTLYKSKKYDDCNITVKKCTDASKGDKTYYKITFGTPFSSVDNYMVFLTCDAGTTSADNSPQGRYAAVYNKTTSGFCVYTGDDETPNESGFSFLIINTYFD